jgi:hypothetical protein
MSIVMHGLKRKPTPLAFFLLLLSLFIMNCSLGIPGDEYGAIRDLMEWNLYDARTEDLSGYMSMPHPEEPGYGDTQAQMTVVFREFDLFYDTEDWKILIVHDPSEGIRVAQVTRELVSS